MTPRHFIGLQLAAFQANLAQVDFEASRQGEPHALRRRHDRLFDRARSARPRRPGQDRRGHLEPTRPGMKLQIDATVLYALGRHKDALSYADLKVASPYNTYLHSGCRPRRSTILAWPRSPRRPAGPCGYLYYVGRADGTGPSLPEHLQPVPQRRRALQVRPHTGSHPSTHRFRAYRRARFAPTAPLRRSPRPTSVVRPGGDRRAGSGIAATPVPGPASKLQPGRSPADRSTAGPRHALPYAGARRGDIRIARRKGTRHDHADTARPPRSFCLSSSSWRSRSCAPRRRSPPPPRPRPSAASARSPPSTGRRSTVTVTVTRASTALQGSLGQSLTLTLTATARSSAIWHGVSVPVKLAGVPVGDLFRRAGHIDATDPSVLVYCVGKASVWQPNLARRVRLPRHSLVGRPPGRHAGRARGVHIVRPARVPG